MDSHDLVEHNQDIRSVLGRIPRRIFGKIRQRGYTVAAVAEHSLGRKTSAQTLTEFVLAKNQLARANRTTISGDSHWNTTHTHTPTTTSDFQRSPADRRSLGPNNK